MDNLRKARMERNIQDSKRYHDEEAASIKTETNNFKGIRIEEADKNLRSILYLALGIKRKIVFSQKLTKKITSKFLLKILGKLSNCLRQENKRLI